MDPTETTIELLKEIRDAVHASTARIDQTVFRLDQTNLKLDETVSRLDETVSRLDQTNARLDQTNTKLGSLEVEVRQGFEAVGAHFTVLTLRMDRLETRVVGATDIVEAAATRFERLERRQHAADMRVATELVAVAAAVREVRDLLRETRPRRTP